MVLFVPFSWLAWLPFAPQWMVAHACDWLQHSQESELIPHKTGTGDASKSPLVACPAVDSLCGTQAKR